MFVWLMGYLPMAYNGTDQVPGPYDASGGWWPPPVPHTPPATDDSGEHCQDPTLTAAQEPDDAPEASVPFPEVRGDAPQDGDSSQKDTTGPITSAEALSKIECRTVIDTPFDHSKRANQRRHASTGPNYTPGPGNSEGSPHTFSDGFDQNEIVFIRGLKRNPELNGLLGIVVGRDILANENGPVRWAVMIHSDKRQNILEAVEEGIVNQNPRVQLSKITTRVSIKQENLLPVRCKPWLGKVIVPDCEREQNTQPPPLPPAGSDQVTSATIHDWATFATLILETRDLFEELGKATRQLAGSTIEPDDPRRRRADIILQTSHRIMDDTQQTLQQRLQSVRKVWPPRDANVRQLLLPDEPKPADPEAHSPVEPIVTDDPTKTQAQAQPAVTAEPTDAEDKEFQRRRKKQRKKARKDQAQVTLCTAAIRRHCYAAAAKESTSGITHETDQPATALPVRSSHSDVTCNAASGHDDGSASRQSRSTVPAAGRRSYVDAITTSGTDGTRVNKSRIRRPPCGRSLSILPLCHSVCLLFYLVATATVHLQPVRTLSSYSAVRSRSLHQTIGSPAAHEFHYSLQQPEQQQPHRPQTATDKMPQQHDPPATDPSGAGITWTRCWESTDEVHWCQGVGSIKGSAPLHAKPPRWSWSPEEGLRLRRSTSFDFLKALEHQHLVERVAQIKEEGHDEQMRTARDGSPVGDGDRCAPVHASSQNQQRFDAPGAAAESASVSQCLPGQQEGIFKCSFVKL